MAKHACRETGTMGGSKQRDGAVLGTLPKAQDRKLASDLHSEDAVIRESAFKKWKTLYNEQQDPEKKFFDSNQQRYRNIQLECPIWSHVRKANPRQADGSKKSYLSTRVPLYRLGIEWKVYLRTSLRMLSEEY